MGCSVEIRKLRHTNWVLMLGKGAAVEDIEAFSTGRHIWDPCQYLNQNWLRVCMDGARSLEGLGGGGVSKERGRPRTHHCDARNLSKGLLGSCLSYLLLRHTASQGDVILPSILNDMSLEPYQVVKGLSSSSFHILHLSSGLCITLGNRI